MSKRQTIELVAKLLEDHLAIGGSPESSERIREGAKTVRELLTVADDNARALREWVDYFDQLQSDEGPASPLTQIRNRVHGARIARSRDALASGEGIVQ